MIRRLAKALLSTIYPNLCEVCGTPLVEGEDLMCLGCRAELPLTNYHQNPDFNSIHERTIGPAKIERAAAYFHYERGSLYAQPIQTAKYRSRPIVGRKLIREYARQLQPLGFFDGIDLIEPVPLSMSKLISRGYNQSYWIAMGIADVTGIAIGSSLKARRHSTQTKRNAAQRQANAASAYYPVKGSAAEGATHVLLVDDIITTGATLRACAKALTQLNPALKISILTLGATRFT
jgi:ComF family protein